MHRPSNVEINPIWVILREFFMNLNKYVFVMLYSVINKIIMWIMLLFLHMHITYVLVMLW